jgi:phospholipid/cholesterol/gamma-HCH transport system substrate-binding protein
MKRRDEVLVGLLVTIAIVVAILGTLWLARGGLSSGYPLHARFPWGAGLRQGQPVLLAGVQVGYVDRVKLRRDGYLDVDLRINDEYQVPDNSLAQVIPVGIFGDMAVALMPKSPVLTSYSPGDTVPVGKPSIGIQDLLARIDTVSTTLHDVTNAIEVELVDKGGMADLRRTLGATNRLVEQLAVIATEQSQQLSATMTTLRRSVSAIDSATVDSTMRNLRSTTANMADLTAGLRETTTQLNGVLGRLERGEGTAGKLLTDTLLYRDVRSLVTRLDSLTIDFKKNPRRYINLEIF